MWVTREFRFFHCTYQWRKMHRALLRDGILDDYAANYSHTERCEAVLTESLTDPEKDVVDAVM